MSFNKIKEFESKIAEFYGAPYAVAVDCCTHGVELCLRYENFSYISDPHGAIGYLGLQKYFKNNPDVYGVFLETAHPVKFLDVVEKAIKKKVSIPPQIEEIMGRKPEKTSISSYRELKEFLIDNAI